MLHHTTTLLIDPSPQAMGLRATRFYQSDLERPDPDPFLRLIISHLSCCHSFLIGLPVSHYSCLYVPLPLPPEFSVCKISFPELQESSPVPGKLLIGIRGPSKPGLTCFTGLMLQDSWLHLHFRHANLSTTLKNTALSTEALSESVARGRDVRCIFYSESLLLSIALLYPSPAFSAHLQSTAHLSSLWSLLWPTQWEFFPPTYVTLCVDV